MYLAAFTQVKVGNGTQNQAVGFCSPAVQFFQAELPHPCPWTHFWPFGRKGFGTINILSWNSNPFGTRLPAQRRYKSNWPRSTERNYPLEPSTGCLNAPIYRTQQWHLHLLSLSIPIISGHWDFTRVPCPPPVYVLVPWTTSFKLQESKMPQPSFHYTFLSSLLCLAASLSCAAFILWAYSFALQSMGITLFCN